MMRLMPMTMKRNPDKEVFCLGSAVDDDDAADDDADDDDDDDAAAAAAANDAAEHVSADFGSCDG